MIQITPHMKVFVHIETVDFRAGIDGLCRICREGLNADPFDGTVFVFRGRRGSSVKVLVYDGQGFWLCQKRLSEGRFMHWPRTRGEAKAVLLAHQLQVLLMAGDPDSPRVSNNWRPVTSAA